VSAPMNFDAMLQARLAEAKTRRTPVWLNTAFYLRAGVATATLAVAVLVAQSSGFFTAPKDGLIQQPDSNHQAVATAPVTGPEPSVPPQGTSPQIIAPTSPSERPNQLVAVASPLRGGHRFRPVTVSTRTGAALPPLEYDLTGSDVPAITDGGAILIRGGNGGRDITVPTVSVGAQPLMYVNAGRQPQSVRPERVSF
jgi:hypothetical protein